MSTLPTTSTLYSGLHIKMNIKPTFRKLITNQFVPDFDYINTEWSFKTVHHVSKYSYCICPCAFEHEYLDYIGDDGSINDDVVEKLTQSIIDGQCPHASKANRDHIDTTGIYGIHIALALGTDKAVSNSYYLMPNRYTKLYKLDPFAIAVMKNRRSVPPMPVVMYVLMNSNRVLEDRVQFYERISDDEAAYIGKEVSVLDLCIRRGNIPVLDLLVKYKCCNNDLGPALNLAFRYQLFDIIKNNLRRLKFDSKEREVEECLTLSIVYDQPYILDFSLQNMSGACSLPSTQRMKLNDTCTVLNRDACREVLERYGISIRETAPPARLMETLWQLLDNYCEDFKDEVETSFNKIPGLSDELTKQRQNKWSFLLKNILGFPEKRNVQVLQTALDLHANPNVRHYSETPLVYLLWCLSTGRAEPSLLTRQKVELFLYQNLDVKAHTGAIRSSLRADAYVKKASTNTCAGSSQRSFIFDSKKHGVYGHDNDNDFAFNFYTPLLIACGFPIPADIETELNQEATNDSVPREVKEYTLMRIKTPKCLIESSRDVLRKHFQGRQIHTFVQLMNIPKQIKDLILLRPLLKCLSKIPD